MTTEAWDALWIAVLVFGAVALLGIAVAMFAAWWNDDNEVRLGFADDLPTGVVEYDLNAKTSDGWETIARWIEEPDGTRTEATPERVQVFMDEFDNQSRGAT